MMPARMRKHAVAAIAYVVLAIAMTWPLVRNMGTAVAYPSDPFINIWILDWDWWATFHSPLSLFDANAFHPARYALAFSENLYGVALLLMPLRFMGVDAITAYNIAMIIGFAFSGFAAWLLGYRLTGSYAGALAAGVFYAFVPFRFTHLSHLQHVWGGWIPMLLVALLWYVERPTWKRGIACGAVFFFNALTNIHWFLLGSFAVAVTVAIFVAAGVRRWRELAISTGVALIALIPFLYPYAAAAKIYGMTRSYAETLGFSAIPSDWLRVSFHNRMYAALRHPLVDAERWLFPGALSLILAAVALFAILRYTRGVVIGAVWCLLGFVGSLGLNFWFHTFLFDAVPGFRAIRAPARWASIAYVGLAILIAVAIAFIEQRRNTRWIAWIFPLLFLVELRAAPINWYQAVAAPPEVYRWLAKQNISGAVLELPVDTGSSEYIYLLRATEHRKRLVNGVSGFVPPQLAKLIAMSREQPIPDSFVDELRRIGTELVIVHADSLANPDSWNWLRRELNRGRITLIRRFDGGIAGDWVFSLRGRGVRSTPQLEAFLSGHRTYNSDTFGWFDPPPKLISGGGKFSGYAFSPWGIRGVDLLFEQGSVRVPARLVPDQTTERIFPWYPKTPNPRFFVSLPRRPQGVDEESDVQAEIIDQRGRRKRLEFFWITWRDK